FLLFAFIASITPGPTNILILTNSQRYGVRNTLPAVVGACVAASAIVLISGAGAGEILRQYPVIRQVMSWAGVL
ncbi:LysE family translocator, partial [Pectobacterium versatile]